MKNSQTMKDLATTLGNRLVPIHNGELTEVKILQILKNKIIVDVGGLTLGIIPEQEFSPEVGDLKVGDKMLAYVLTIENDDGYVILSLRRADKERVSKILHTKFESGEVLPVKVLDANKGGLLCQFGDYEGFLPVSQLATSHYPKVASGNREEILSRLKSLVGQTLQVKVLSFEPGSGKLIFSEKAAGDIAQFEKIKGIKIDDVLEGEITGIVDFGLFVKIKIGSDEVEGLVHISEASWEHVDDLKSQFKIGDKIKVKVISKEDNRLSLSLKRLESDPWLKLASSHKVGDVVSAKVTKNTAFGSFVKLGVIDGLVHISELGDKVTDPKSVVEEGKSYKFKIMSIEPELHKLSLSLKAVTEKEKPAKSVKKETKPKKTKKGAK
ncbi:MAG: RNA binding S1 domain protein [Berkelbacteria bacterium GW2011_GWA1_36_9]|uniref:RNA binding S1 domain protein n=1 Tax=Berkelbacteria bacterium GW2011_GWA1_36_9 TaxID=1618331 RepID=A0A0G0FG19_9BACT|nr:MAG: RNA binding S1 domain protein [Berkelbacteria bacterium GW2011_GWA1_36_9]